MKFDIGRARLWIVPESPSLAAPAGLTDAELTVARLVALGRSNAEIARLRARSVRTIANQVAAILRKLGVTSRVEIAARIGDGATAG